TDEQAAQAPCASSLSIGGLLTHAAAMEQSWVDMIRQRPRPSREEQEAGYGEDFRFGPGDTLVDALARLDAVAKETEAVVAGVDLDAPVPVPRGVPWFPQDIEAWSVRWVLLHVVEELARHAGHADIIRETIDGATMYELL